jgi:hypothetical protein
MKKLAPGSTGRIGNFTKQVMIGTALFFDLLQGMAGLLDFVLPGLGAAISFVIWLFGMLTIWFIFRINGVGLIGEIIRGRAGRRSNKKAQQQAMKEVIRSIAKISSTLADSLVGFWPGLTILTIFTISQVRAHDQA